MKFVPPDTCLEDYQKGRKAFLKELIASTPNVSMRAKEFRRWINENSPYGDAEALNRRRTAHHRDTKRKSHRNPDLRTKFFSAHQSKG